MMPTNYPHLLAAFRLNCLYFFTLNTCKCFITIESKEHSNDSTMELVELGV